ncbi:hypothetical protein OXYTRIMIC_613 [Oxytricha trifallax]|uniref:Uncharacterized protein n=1 Tax=Oxytricha trifallax TaxID=1172189 RepID=A0A073ICP0_9SPIT|nr:hypothetical protein OXYTRIMIC_613 [Oxytricha trifallax]
MGKNKRDKKRHDKKNKKYQSSSDEDGTIDIYYYIPDITKIDEKTQQMLLSATTNIFATDKEAKKYKKMKELLLKELEKKANAKIITNYQIQDLETQQIGHAKPSVNDNCQEEQKIPQKEQSHISRSERGILQMQNIIGKNPLQHIFQDRLRQFDTGTSEQILQQKHQQQRQEQNYENVQKRPKLSPIIETQQKEFFQGKSSLQNLDVQNDFGIEKLDETRALQNLETQYQPFFSLESLVKTVNQCEQDNNQHLPEIHQSQIKTEQKCFQFKANFNISLINEQLDLHRQDRKSAYQLFYDQQIYDKMKNSLLQQDFFQVLVAIKELIASFIIEIGQIRSQVMVEEFKTLLDILIYSIQNENINELKKVSNMQYQYTNYFYDYVYTILKNTKFQTRESLSIFVLYEFLKSALQFEVVVPLGRLIIELQELIDYHTKFQQHHIKLNLAQYFQEVLMYRTIQAIQDEKFKKDLQIKYQNIDLSSLNTNWKQFIEKQYKPFCLNK